MPTIQPRKRIYKRSKKTGLWRKVRTSNVMKVAQLDEILDTANNRARITNRELADRIRLLLPSTVYQLHRLLESESELIRLGAIRLILSKVMPDLKAVDITSSDTIRGLVIVRNEQSDTIDITSSAVTSKPQESSATVTNPDANLE